MVDRRSERDVGLYAEAISWWGDWGMGLGDDDDVCIGERRKLEGETENMGVWTRISAVPIYARNRMRN